jgi:predicted DNA-binding WGR domain protein
LAQSVPCSQCIQRVYFFKVMWDPVYLRFIDPVANKLRFYSIHVTKSVFSDEWEVVREWGRIGSPGTVRTEAFKEQQAAEAHAEMFKAKKIKKGYCECSKNNV